MKEYYVVAHSFAAPFVSDTSKRFVCGETPGGALTQFVANYEHPCGLYSAAIFTDANAEAKRHAPLMRWQSNAAQKLDGDPKEGGFLPGSDDE